MPLDIVLPLAALPILVVVVMAVYRRTMTGLAPDDDRAVPGYRLTSERLRLLGSPWRVVYEIGGGRLGDVDHVAIGPPGVIAIVTVMTDRPESQLSDEPTLVAAAAMARGDVDDLVRKVGQRCDTLVKVFWGVPQPDRPPAVEITHGSLAVEGQRLEEWIASLPGDRSAAEIDLAWQAVVTGIGRPDPLS